MRVRHALLVSVASLGLALALTKTELSSADGARTAPHENGVVKVKSAHPLDEAVARLKADIAGKGIMFFQAVDQSRLTQDAGIKLSPSTLLTFGNPALGTHFITARPEAGLDWPVRLLVHEDAEGQVWAAYTDFAWIARRHGITNRDAEFAMASKVIGSITSSIAAK